MGVLINMWGHPIISAWGRKSIKARKKIASISISVVKVARRCPTSGAALALAERINRRADDSRFAALGAPGVEVCGLLRMRAAVLENAAEWLLCRRTLPALASCHLHAARTLRLDLRAAGGSCHA